MVSETAAKLPGAYLRGLFVPAALWAGCMLFGAIQYQLITQDMLPSDVDGAQLYAIGLFVFVLLVSFILEVLNFPIIQAYEGIAPGIVAFCLQPMQKRALSSFEDLRKKIEKIRDSNPDKAYEMEQELLLSFPSQAQDILPTRLGNTIAAFEHYSYRRYGIDAITIWPRLQTVVSSDHLKRITSAKSGFDFWINVSFLFLCTAFTSALVLWHYVDVMSYMQGLSACLLVSWVSYRAGIGAAITWGESVKAAFDVYRLDLLKALGAKSPRLTLTAEQEKQIWRELQWSMKFSYVPDANIVEFELPQQKKEKSPQE
jgi:hypothetical protein